MTDRCFNLDEIRQIIAEEERRMSEMQEQRVREYQELAGNEEGSDG